MDISSYFTENRKKVYLAVVVVIMVIIAFLGYAFEKKSQPEKIAIATKGGGVIFNHQLHVSLKDTGCKECHHNYVEGKDDLVMKCRDCHYGKNPVSQCDNAAIHKRCIGKNCMDCHAPGQVDCTFCHNAEDFTVAAQPEKVEFETDGGKVVFDHMAHASEDGAGIGCADCHHGYDAKKAKTFPMSCRRCHYNTKYEALCENADTHNRCIGNNCLGCHSDGVDDCTICHEE